MAKTSGKTTFTFNEDATGRLDELAGKKGTSKSEILRRAITLYDYLDKQKSQTGEVTIVKPNGEKVELVLP